MKVTKMFLTFLSAVVMLGACNKDGDVETPTKPTVNTRYVTFESHSPEAVDISVKSSENWTVSEPADWYTLAITDAGFKLTANGDNLQPTKLCDTLTVSNSLGSTTIEVTQLPNLPASLQGSDYYVIVMDDDAVAALGSNVKYDIRMDSPNCMFNSWNGGITDFTVPTDALGFYGAADGWYHKTGDTSTKWCSGGFKVTEPVNLDMTPLSTNTDKWYFHMAIRGDVRATFEFKLDFGNGSNSYLFKVGATDADHGPLTAGEWTVIEIPMADVMAAGWVAKDLDNTAANTFTLKYDSALQDLHELEVDAVFIYKKK